MLSTGNTHGDISAMLALFFARVIFSEFVKGTPTLALMFLVMHYHCC